MIWCVVVQWSPMTAKETTLDTILSTVERGFASVAGDIGEMKSEIGEVKSAMATKDDIADLRNEMASKADVRNI